MKKAAAGPQSCGGFFVPASPGGPFAGRNHPRSINETIFSGSRNHPETDAAKNSWCSMWGIRHDTGPENLRLRTIRSSGQPYDGCARWMRMQAVRPAKRMTNGNQIGVIFSCSGKYCGMVYQTVQEPHATTQSGCFVCTGCQTMVHR